MASVALSRQYGSPQEIATFTGLSVRTVRRLYTSGRLVAHKIDRRVLIAFEDVEVFVRRSIRHSLHPPGSVPSALTPEGRAYPFSSAETGARVRQAIASLDELADDTDDPEVDQVEALSQLCKNLQANRGEL